MIYELTPVEAATVLLFGCAFIAIIVLLVIGSRRQISVDVERHQDKHQPGAHPKRRAKPTKPATQAEIDWDPKRTGWHQKPPKAKRRS